MEKGKISPGEGLPKHHDLHDQKKLAQVAIVPGIQLNIVKVTITRWLSGQPTEISKIVDPSHSRHEIV